ncbi:MAG: MATE family efflux transporter [Clostridia bacterium]|nr:MATE family efflux transporter [Clostridia bacterium]
MKTNDMTIGNPIKLILYFAIPLFIGNIFQQVYSIVDTMIAGYNLGDGAIAAIGATSSLYSLLIDFAVGLNSGYGIVVSRFFGAKDRDNVKRSVAAMLVLNILTTVVMTIISLVFLRPLMHILNVPQSIFEDAHIYIFIILAGMTATIAYNMFAGILRAVGNSRAPLIFLIISCAINLGMDVLFIMVLHFGVAGAAIATVIAESISALMAGSYICSKYKDILPKKQHFKFSFDFMREMITSGLAMGIMLCVVDIGSVIYQRAINHLGELLIISHTAARRIIGIFMMPLASIATANSTFVSQNCGARKFERIHATLKKVMFMEVVWGVFSCMLVFLLGDQFVVFLTSTEDSYVIENAVLSMRIHFLLYPALGILLALRTTLQAMGEKVIPVISSGFELVIKIITGIWIIPMIGYICVCLTEPVIWAICMVFLVVVFVVQKPIKRAENRLN